MLVKSWQLSRVFPESLLYCSIQLPELECVAEEGSSAF